MILLHVVVVAEGGDVSASGDGGGRKLLNSESVLLKTAMRDALVFRLLLRRSCVT